jgi:hypothetical protein
MPLVKTGPEAPFARSESHQPERSRALQRFFRQSLPEVRSWCAKSFEKSSKKPHTPLKFIGNLSVCAFLAARVRIRALRWEGQDDGKERAVSESRSGEHQELVERFEAEVSEHIADRAAPTAEHTVSNTREATDRSYYTVALANETDNTYTVAIAYRTSDRPDEIQTMQLPASPGGAALFFLTAPGQCASLVSYVLGCYIDSQLDVRVPSAGVFTPERIRREFPSDTEPCSDAWVVQ